MARQRAYSADFRHLPNRPETYCIVTYGCQMNAHDSEKLAGMLDEMGLAPAKTRETADLILSNTCCIRDNAERKALGNVTWLKELKKENPALLIGICGCMVQEDGMAEVLAKKYPFVDFAFGTGNLYRLPEILYRAVSEKQRVIAVEKEQSTLFEGVPVTRESPYQAYVTVMYGCNNFCSYCIVPYVRGRERSRAADDIVKEAEALVASGVKEIMLLGQNVNSYGHDLAGGASFAQLLRRVGETGIPRIRFMTSHPKDLSDELIEEIACNKAVQRHFHLPVQSGSDRILQLMNRRYTREKYLSRVKALRDAVPDIGITTDLIVGFPGETEADFEDTLSLVDLVRYDSAFTFIYSPREGTVAERMEGRIPDDISTKRIETLIALQEKKTSEVFSSLIGGTEQVLVTGFSRRDGAMLTGKGGRGISVNFPGDESAVGKILPVQITSAGKTTLRGEQEKE